MMPTAIDLFADLVRARFHPEDAVVLLQRDTSREQLVGLVRPHVVRAEPAPPRDEADWLAAMRRWAARDARDTRRLRTRELWWREPLHRLQYDVGVAATGARVLGDEELARLLDDVLSRLVLLAGMLEDDELPDVVAHSRQKIKRARRSSTAMTRGDAIAALRNIGIHWTERGRQRAR